jgi:hypothetical protein
MVLWGFVMGPHDGSKVPKGVKWALGILILLVVAGAVLIYTGTIDTVTDFFDTSSSSLWTNILFIVIILGAIAVVVGFGKSGGAGSGGDAKKKEGA